MKSPVPLLEADRVVVRRGGRAIVEAVSGRLAPGRLTVLLGPNGAGKSTLLKVLAGDLRADGGEARLADRPLPQWDRLALARRRAVLPQESALHFPFRVEEVVAMGRSPHFGRSSRSRDRAICASALRAVEMWSARDRRYPSLSGGEKQRVDFARVLAQLDTDEPEDCPQVLFLDEPTASLDPHHQAHLLGLARARARQGTAVLAIIHDLNLAMAFADEVWLMRDGRLVERGSPAEVLRPEPLRAVFGVEVALWQEPGAARPLIAMRHAPLSRTAREVSHA